MIFLYFTRLIETSELLGRNATNLDFSDPSLIEDREDMNKFMVDVIKESKVTDMVIVSSLNVLNSLELESFKITLVTYNIATILLQYY